MTSLPVEVLFGIYLGLLAGIVPALVSGALGFIFKYFTGVTLPGLGVVVLATAVAGVNGGLMGLLEESIKTSPRLLVATIVVMMLALWAHSQGDKLGANMPRRFSLSALRKRTLSTEVVDFVGGVGKVTLRATGPIRDMEGYPPLSSDLRTELATGSWQLPADLPLSELETRLAERLKTEYDLADASVSLDSQGRASITAAPPSSGLSRRIPPGERAVSVQALVPTGCTRGDELLIRSKHVLESPETTDGPGNDPTDTESAGTGHAGETTVSESNGGTVGGDAGTPPDPVAEPEPVTEERLVRGRLLSADSGDGSKDKKKAAKVETDGGEDDVQPATPSAPTTAGGDGRVTVALPRSAATDLLDVDRARIAVESRGTRREFELVSLLRRSGKRFQKVTVRADGPLDGVTLGEASVRDTYDVAILAIRHPVSESDGEARRRWAFSPSGTTQLHAGDELFAVGRRPALSSFVGVVA
ncbi:potassium channel family protein [Haloarchaeobius sp. TZWWS8]|uniref:potassium channel family protein n=1 Tax=Haloarchaeobius sp. TZWWS8 TaxID=3446121 RepID=UPI003EB9930D